MSNIPLLILPSVVKDRMVLHSNTDDKLIVPEIKAAQDMRVRPILGSVLYDKLLADIASNSLTGEYKKIMDNYIVDAICNYVMAELPEGLNYQFWNKGVATKTTDNSQAPSMSDMYSIVSKYKKRAEHYANACRLYIIQNIAKFPEYYATGGIDRVTPERGVYTSPIYLGNSGNNDDYYRLKSNDPNFNTNDPYYSSNDPYFMP